jgi:hypothetical protein
MECTLAHIAVSAELFVYCLTLLENHDVQEFERSVMQTLDFRPRKIREILYSCKFDNGQNSCQ